MSSASDHQGDMLESLFEVVPQLLCVIGPDGRLKRVNPRWEVVLGFTAAELEGMPLMDLAHPEDLAAAQEELAKAQAGNTVFDFAARFRAKDGSYRLLLWRATSHGEANVFASARDVTTENQIAAEMERQRDLLERTEAAARMGSWRIDLATGVATRSQGVFDLLGVPRETGAFRLGELGDRVLLPEDLPTWHAAIDAVRRGEAPGPFEARFVTPDGRVRWVRMETQHDNGPDGRPAALVGFIQDITERKESELALAESEELLQESQQVARVGHYLFDIARDWWDGSEVLYDMWGIGPRYKRDFEGWLALCHPDDHEMMRAYVVEGVVGRGEAFNKQYRIVRPSDGVTRWMYGHGKVDVDDEGRPVSLFGVIQDITELKAAEEQFRRERDQLTAIMETSRVAIVFVDPERRIVMANRRAEEVMGLSKTDITSRTYDAPDWRSTSVDGGPLRTEELAVRRVFDTGEEVRDVRQAIEWPDGRRVIISINAAPLKDADGTITGVVAVFDDITDEVRADEAIRTLNEDLEARVQERTAELESAMRTLAAMNLQLEEASEAKSRLLANMSHELRTPLNSVIGFSTILLQGMAGPLNQEQERQLGMIKRGGTQLLGLVNDILDLTRVEAGVTQLELSDFQVGEMVDPLIDSMRPQVEEKGLELGAAVSCGGLTMHSDSGKISQVLLNLLSNAVKFTEEGSIGVTCEEDRGDVVFRVTDTGIGIPAEELPRIMEDFHQVDRLEDGMKPRGTGLGLAISWRLADMLGGTLTAESTVGEGSTFTLRVPMRLERRSTDHAQSAVPNPS